MGAKEVLERWTPDKSAELYGIKNWGNGYFDVSPKGDVVITPTFNGNGKKAAVSIMDILSGVRDRGLDMPVLLRIENFLDSQLSRLNESFRKAIGEFGYKGIYKGVYPIKVNQQQQVVEEVTRFGARYHHGLEAGSKAELIAALAMLQDKEACLICNGYKDEEFIDLGLQAIKMGYQCFFVLEMPGELNLIIERSRKLGIRPLLGVRLKLSSKVGGHWTESGGDRSIFGLTTTQLVDMIDTLKNEGMLDCLRLLHFHLGSQVPNIRDIRQAVFEGSRYYADLVEEGAPMGHLDLGGGLAVDYDGSQTNYVHSKNYTLDEYTADIIEVIMTVLDEKEIPHPTVLTESGRALVAYHSVLLMNVLDVAQFVPKPLPESLPEGTHEMIVNMLEVNQNLGLKNVQECVNDAIYYRDEIRQLFRHGEISLRDRAIAENLFLHIVQSISENVKKMKRVPPGLDDLDEALADVYYANFSVFQSLPDSWAIDQVFPIMPLHRLKEQPSREAILADITCDCDGKIDSFVDLHDKRKTLPLHQLKDNEEYYLGIFIVGAYQETLGDLHNLLGDTHVVSIRIHEDGTYDIVREIEGDAISDVLSYVEYDPRNLTELFRKKAENAVKEGLITPRERREIIERFESSMRGYTYFER